MTEHQWMKEFATYVAQCLEEDVCPWHYAVVDAWVDVMGDMTPEDAVKEEFSYWGE